MKQEGKEECREKDHSHKKENNLTMLELICNILLSVFLKPYDKIYGTLNTQLTQSFQTKGLPKYITANLITYVRTTLIIPTILLLSRNYVVVPILLLLTNDILDSVDGIVARYWLQKLDQDEICFVLDSDSTTTKTRKRHFGEYLDAVLDKIYLVPLWICLISLNQSSMLSMFVLWPLIMIETTSGFVRTVQYYTKVGVSASNDLMASAAMSSTSSINSSRNISTIKQMLEIFGSAFLMVPLTYYIGILILMLSWPLAIESVRRKLEKKVIYVTCDASPLSEQYLLFLQQAKSLGSTLIVGIESKSKDGTDYEQRRREVLCLFYVDACIDAAPTLKDIDVDWMSKSGIDKIVCSRNDSKEMKKTMLTSNDVLIL